MVDAVIAEEHQVAALVRHRFEAACIGYGEAECGKLLVASRDHRRGVVDAEIRADEWGEVTGGPAASHAYVEHVHRTE
jgi:hypothetical protein